MGSRRSLKLAGVLAVVGVAVAAAILVNLALLGYAQPRNDPVGKLSPRAALTPSPAPAPVPPTRTKRGRDDGNGHDD